VRLKIYNTSDDHRIIEPGIIFGSALMQPIITNNKFPAGKRSRFYVLNIYNF